MGSLRLILSVNKIVILTFHIEGEVNNQQGGTEAPGGKESPFSLHQCQ